MDFIERLFGISPDGGDGSTELLYIAVLLLVVALFRWREAIAAIVRKALGR